MDQSLDYVQSHYALCPYEQQVCGDSRIVIPDVGGAEVRMTSFDNPKTSDFIFGQLCTYLLNWPENAKENDTMTVTADELESGATVYAATQIFSTESDAEEKHLASIGASFTVEWPRQVWLTAVASDTGSASGFRLSATYYDSPVVPTDGNGETTEDGTTISDG